MVGVGGVVFEPLALPLNVFIRFVAPFNFLSHECRSEGGGRVTVAQCEMCKCIFVSLACHNVRVVPFPI